MANNWACQRQTGTQKNCRCRKTSTATRRESPVKCILQHLSKQVSQIWTDIIHSGEGVRKCVHSCQRGRKSACARNCHHAKPSAPPPNAERRNKGVASRALAAANPATKSAASWLHLPPSLQGDHDQTATVTVQELCVLAFFVFSSSTAHSTVHHCSVADNALRSVLPTWLRGTMGALMRGLPLHARQKPPHLHSSREVWHCIALWLQLRDTL